MTSQKTITLAFTGATGMPYGMRLLEQLLANGSRVFLLYSQVAQIVAQQEMNVAIHLENMLRLARAGAIILPANPGFYHHPRSVEGLVDFVVARILDQLGVPNDLMVRWGDEKSGVGAHAPKG